MGNKNSGRRPKPTNLKVFEGNPGKRPLPENEPQPDPPSSLEPPDDLSEDAQAFWRRNAPPLVKMGLLTEVDMDQFALLCDAYARVKKTQKEIDAWGNTLKYSNAEGGTIIKGNPSVNAYNIYMAQVTKLAQKFGMAAADRSGIKVPESDTVEGPAAFFGGRKKRDRDRDDI